MKTLLGSLLVFALSLLPAHLLSQTGVAGTGAKFLDLPDGFGFQEDEEDEPELIEFYNDEYEGDAFFFCLDRSSSMGEPAANGKPKFEVLKGETVRAMTGLSERSVVSIIFYDFNLQPLVYGDPPIKMNGAGKGKLIGQIISTQISHGSCMSNGAVKCLDLAMKTKNEHRMMILTSDGRTQCSTDEADPDRVFQKIISRNTLRLPINTIYTGATSGDDWTLGKPLLERLARATNGRFKIAM
jgi:hypothetical protein